MKDGHLMCRLGSTYELFADFIDRKHKFYQRMLVIMMIKSGESLEYVMDQLLSGRKIKGTRTTPTRY